MKSLILIVFLSSLWLHTWSQDNPNLQLINDNISLSVFSDIWQGVPDSIHVKKINTGFDGALVYRFKIIPAIDIALGAGIQVHSMYHNAFISLNKGDSSIFTPIAKELAYTKNKLTLTYLKVPVEIRIRNKPEIEQTYKFFIGAEAGWLISSYTKYKGDNPANTSEKVKIKDSRLPNINKLIYCVYTRFGYKEYALTVSYLLNTIYKTDKGPAIKPISIGISLML